MKTSLLILMALVPATLSAPVVRWSFNPSGLYEAVQYQGSKLSIYVRGTVPGMSFYDTPIRVARQKNQTEQQHRDQAALLVEQLDYSLDE